MENTAHASEIPESTAGQRDATPVDVAKVLDESLYMKPLLDIRTIAALDLRDNPSIQSAIRYMTVQGGNVVDTVGSPLLCILFEIPGKGFCIYSDISKRFYNKDISIGIPEVIPSIQYIEHLNRVGIYIGTEVSTGRNLYVFMDFALNKSPIHTGENNKQYPYYSYDIDSASISDYREALTIVM